MPCRSWSRSLSGFARWHWQLTAALRPVSATAAGSYPVYSIASGILKTNLENPMNWISSATCNARLAAWLVAPLAAAAYTGQALAQAWQPERAV